MEASKVHKELLASGSRVRVPVAEKLIPRSSGIYAIFVDEGDLLRLSFSDCPSGQDVLLYVGQASGSLYARLLEQDLRHRTPSTFFRGLGAALGYHPPAGSLVGKKNKNNYKFSPDDSGQIRKWIDAHVLVSWAEVSQEELDTIERELVLDLRPPLNTVHNPAPSALLASLRKTCRDIAREPRAESLRTS